MGDILSSETQELIRQQAIKESGGDGTDINDPFIRGKTLGGSLAIDVDGDIDPAQKKSGNTSNRGVTTPSKTAAAPVAGDEEDMRIRISALDTKQAEMVYGPNDPLNNILTPLYNTGGLMFPYTPSINVSHEAYYQSHDLIHSNYEILSFQRSAAATIGITGKFTVQNQREGEYALAVIHFLRTVTKMYFGDQDADTVSDNGLRQTGKAGLPPPVLRLRGYGNYMFKDVRVVVKNYSYNFDENMDMVRINIPAKGYVMLPPLFSITVGLGIQQSPKRSRSDFNLDKFRTGELMRGDKPQNKGWF